MASGDFCLIINSSACGEIALGSWFYFIHQAYHSMTPRKQSKNNMPAAASKRLNGVTHGNTICGKFIAVKPRSKERQRDHR